MHDIPFIDIRDGGPLALAQSHTARAKKLIEASTHSFGLISRLGAYLALPVGDYLSQRWLHKTHNPYLGEIDQTAKLLGVTGVHALNLCFEWGCTTGAYQKEGRVVLARVLDWVFPALGENVVVAHQRGAAGDFYNVTWPGVSGVLTAMAPGRFAAAINQAPMRRHGLSMPFDWIMNRFMMFRATGWPPAHLLRHVFETAGSYEEAKEILMTMPVALPVIFTLTGTKAGEGCVIERTENDAVLRPLEQDRVCTANHFVTRLDDTKHGWHARPIDSRGRLRLAQTLPTESLNKTFDWVSSPMMNAHTRVIVLTDATSGELDMKGVYKCKTVSTFAGLPSSGT